MPSRTSPAKSGSSLFLGDPWPVHVSTTKTCNYNSYNTDATYFTGIYRAVNKK